MMMYEDTKAGDNVSIAKCQEQQADTREKKQSQLTRKWGEWKKNRANVGKKEEPAYGEKLQGQWQSSEIKEYSSLNTLMKNYKLEG